MSDERSEFPPQEEEAVPTLAEAASEAPPRRRRATLCTILAWPVIIAVVTLQVFLQGLTRSGDNPLKEKSAAGLDAMDLQIKYLVGARSVLEEVANATGAPGLNAGQGQEFLSQLEDLKRGSPEDRLRFVILTGELADSQEAVEQAKDSVRDLQTEGIPLTPEQRHLFAVLRRLYADYVQQRWQAPSVTPAEIEALREKLGWLGRLALVPAGAENTPGEEERAEVLAPAQQIFLVVALGFTLGSCLAFLGAGGGVIFLGLLFSGRLKFGLHFAAGHGGIYAETFALWMVTYTALSVAAALVIGLGLEEARFLILLAAFFGSLVVLAWPVIRGIPWSRVRQDIGWHAGQGVVVEAPLGVVTYILTLPLLVIGAILMLVLAYVVRLLSAGDENSASQIQNAAHPVVQYVIEGDWWERLQLLILASVAAPIVEETMFRGVLYRHLRELTGGWSLALSVLASGLLVSFIFAVIHPQGWLAVPALMGLAFGFTIAREWRGSLIPCMIAHGISNGLVMLLLLFALGE